MSAFSVYKRRVLHWKCIPIGIAHTASFPAPQNLFLKQAESTDLTDFAETEYVNLKPLLLPTVSIIIMHFMQGRGLTLSYGTSCRG